MASSWQRAMEKRVKQNGPKKTLFENGKRLMSPPDKPTITVDATVSAAARHVEQLRKTQFKVNATKYLKWLDKITTAGKRITALDLRRADELTEWIELNKSSRISPDAVNAYSDIVARFADVRANIRVEKRERPADYNYNRKQMRDAQNKVDRERIKKTSQKKNYDNGR